MKKVELYVPGRDELGYREKLLSDPATMSYNSGYNLGLPGYHNDTGCLDFPPEKWDAWFDGWIGREPERYYAYIVADGCFVGEVCLHSLDGGKSHELGILIEASRRGEGLAKPALTLLLEHAFLVLGSEEVLNSFEPERKAALRLHVELGFNAMEACGMMFLSFPREKFLAGR